MKINLKTVSMAAGVAACALVAAGPAMAFASTASETVSAGSLAFVSAPGAIEFSGVTLNGLTTDQHVSATNTFDISDATASNAGYNVTVAGSAWSNGFSPTATVTAGDASSFDTNSIDGIQASNTASYPVTVSTDGTTQALVYGANVNTGQGNQTNTMHYSLAVPGASAPGSYSATWTFTLSSGPGN